MRSTDPPRVTQLEHGRARPQTQVSPNSKPVGLMMTIWYLSQNRRKRRETGSREVGQKHKESEMWKKRRLKGLEGGRKPPEVRRWDIRTKFGVGRQYNQI